MRGKVLLWIVVYKRGRITPAYAGKSLSVGVLWIHNEDHPRLCGEKLLSYPHASSSQGSPPPMRGKDSRRFVKRFLLRITPAYAGKRPVVIAERVSFRDHPRLCGEKAASVSPSSTSVGSPPPMRGKVFLIHTIMGEVRITPAYAGKSV